MHFAMSGSDQRLRDGSGLCRRNRAQPRLNVRQSTSGQDLEKVTPLEKIRYILSNSALCEPQSAERVVP